MGVDERLNNKATAAGTKAVNRISLSPYFLLAKLTSLV
jgi:hypothetical protein